MFVVHIKNIRRLAVIGGGAVLAVALLCVLVGCFGKSSAPDQQPISAASNDERLAYLTELGWQVDPEPIETLNLQLPEDLAEECGEYVAIQDQQGLPFGQFGGKTVSRYTYTVTNYPDCSGPVQVNLYVCDERLIGGDVVATGENGFVQGLAFPE